MPRTSLPAFAVALLLPVLAAGPATAAGEECYFHAATIVALPGGGPLAGTSGDDVIVGSETVDQIDGNGGTDVICGGGGNDVINTGAGELGLAFGGPGNDTITVAAEGGYGGGEDGEDELVATVKGVFLDGGADAD